MTRHTVNGISIYTESIKARQPGDAHPIVFLHGLGSSTRDWEQQRTLFSAHNDVLLVDLRGHGQSDKPKGPYTISQMATDIAMLLSGLETTSAHIVGLSMGAQVALQLALDYPDQVRSITAVNCPASMRPERLKDKLAVLQRKGLVRMLGMERVGHVLAKRLLPGEQFKQRREVFAQRWAENDLRAYEASLNAILDWDIRDRLAELTQPLLVVAAQQDYTPLAWKQALANNAPNAQLAIIDNSRHATPVERPDAFNQVLKEFLRTAGSAVQTTTAKEPVGQTS